MHSHFLEKIKKAGFKLTPRRRAIIELFIAHETHLTPEDVRSELKKKIKRCGFPGVYRNLEALADCGVLVRVQRFDRKRHYGLCCLGHGHHHHIVCVKCGRVEEMKDCLLDGAKKIKGYKVVSHFIQVNGICGDCSG